VTAITTIFEEEVKAHHMIKMLRYVHKLSLAEIGHIIGVRENTVRAWYTGKRAPSSSNRKRLYELYHQKLTLRNKSSWKYEKLNRIKVI
jgi:DNA-binding transcriptional regulator YiaG